MLTLAYRNLRTRPGRTLLAALAIALGVSMIFAMRIVAATVEQTAAEVRAGRLAGADLEVAAADHALLRATLALTLAARPEVAAAAPIYRRTAWVPVDYDWTGHAEDWPPVTLHGVDPAHTLSPYTLTGGHFLTGADRREVLLPAAWAAIHHIGVGDTITVGTEVQYGSYTVQGLLADEATGVLGDLPVVWMPLEAAQAAFGTPGAATQMLLRLQPRVAVKAARDRLRADLGPTYEVSSAGGGAPQTRAYLTTLTDLALPLAGLVILVAGAFLVYNAFAITLTERRQEIGQLRLLGMTRGQVLRQTLLEALIVALLGGAAGLPLGWLVGRDMVPRLVGMLQNHPVSALVVPAAGAPLALGTGVLVTLAAIFSLARRTSRVSPLAALQSADDGAGRVGGFLRWSWIGALGALALFGVLYAGTILAARQGADAFNLSFLAPLCLLVAVLCALPVGVRAALWIFARATRHGSAAQRIAARNLSRRPERTVLTTATLTIGLLLLVTLTGVTQTSASVLHETVASLFAGDFLLMRYFPDASSDFAIMSTLPSLGPSAPYLQATVDDLHADAEVLRIAGIHLPGLGLGPGLDNAFALDLPIVRGKAAFPVVEGSWDQAAQIFAAGPALTLSELAAHRLGVHPGDTVPVDTLEGKVPFRVALVGGPFPIISSEAGIRYFHSYPVWFLLTVRPGHDKAAVQARLDDLSGRSQAYYDADPQQLIGGSIDWLLNTILGLFAGLTALSGIIGGFGVVNTLLAAVLERQRELGMLRALGMSRRQVRAMLVAEAALVGLTGAAIGVLGGLALTLAYSGLIRTLIAETAGYTPGTGALPWGMAGAALLAGPLVAVLAALYPAARAAAVAPAEAMRADSGSGWLRGVRRQRANGRRGLRARVPAPVQVALLAGGILIVTTAGLTAYQVESARALYTGKMTALLQTQLDYFAATARRRLTGDLTTLSPATLLELQEDAQAQAALLRGQLGTVRYFQVTDVNHRIWFSKQPADAGQVPADPVTPPADQATVRRTTWRDLPVYEGTAALETATGVPVGYVIVGVDADDVDWLPAQAGNRLLGPGAVALLIALGLTFAGTRFILRPARRPPPAPGPARDLEASRRADLPRAADQ